MPEIAKVSKSKGTSPDWPAILLVNLSKSFSLVPKRAYAVFVIFSLTLRCRSVTNYQNMKTTSFILILTLLATLSACSIEPIEDTSNEGNDTTQVETLVLGPENIPTDWELLDAGDFILYAPSSWVLEAGTGYDSNVGTITNGEITLNYDYGMHASQFANSSNYDSASYDMTVQNLNGFDGIIYTSIDEDGFTTLNVIDAKGASSLNLYGRDLNDEQESLVIDIFKTIFFKQ
jgi:hypothetical protein